MDLYNTDEMKETWEVLREYVNEIDRCDDLTATESDEPSEEECVRIEDARAEKMTWQVRLAEAVRDYINDYSCMTVADWNKWDKKVNGLV